MTVGQVSDVQLLIENVINLYGLEFRLRYDPFILEVVDADPDLGGIQIDQGAFPSPDFVVRNEVDIDAGTIWYAVTQLSPRPPVNGSGTVLTIRFRARNVGVSMIDIDHAQLVSPKGVEISAESSGGVVLVSGEGATQAPPPPTSTPTPPAMYTYTPSATGGEAPTVPVAPTSTSLPGATSTPTPTRLAQPAASSTSAGLYPYPVLYPTTTQSTSIQPPIEKPTATMPGAAPDTPLPAGHTPGSSQQERPEVPEIAATASPPGEYPPSGLPESGQTQLAPTQPLGKLVAIIPTVARRPTAKPHLEEVDPLIPPEMFTCIVVLLVLFTIALAVYLVRSQRRGAP